MTKLLIYPDVREAWLALVKEYETISALLFYSRPLSTRTIEVLWACSLGQAFHDKMRSLHVSIRTHENCASLACDCYIVSRSEYMWRLDTLRTSSGVAIPRNHITVCASSGSGGMCWIAQTFLGSRKTQDPCRALGSYLAFTVYFPSLQGV